MLGEEIVAGITDQLPDRMLVFPRAILGWTSSTYVLYSELYSMR